MEKQVCLEEGHRMPTLVPFQCGMIAAQPCTELSDHYQFFLKKSTICRAGLEAAEDVIKQGTREYRFRESTRHNEEAVATSTSIAVAILPKMYHGLLLGKLYRSSA
jgi:hypothetical protein